MTSKKRRQRGSRTHGGGSHKKRRGAGNRGGRGRAGRTKHEKANYPPQGKKGFSTPQKQQRTVETVNLRELDEDVPLYVEEGIAEESGDGYAIDARDVVDAGSDVDVVKVLAGGQLHESLEVTADAFSEDAEAKLADAGGEAVLTEHGEQLAAEEATTDEDDEDE
ncbi:uL15m family ribosomal protein [Halorarius halobius]|uniref:uL15m family ribosomal protein n=1 Tax=Halorarius halobius TaxID=2962671 RepID=UPI0020CEB810|nr:uL15m family ribosomal protein [Halorarius halobius]